MAEKRTEATRTPPSATKSTSTAAPPASTGKSRLGRGLASLIRVDLPETPATPAPEAGAPSAPPSASKSQVAQVQPNARESQPARETATAIAAPVSANAPYLATLPLASVRANPHQPRKSFDDVALAELAESIRANGLIQPITVRKTPDGYELIAGERRTRASRQLGLQKITAIVVPADSHTQAQQALVENIQRQDLNPIDRALGYAALLDELGLTQEELARRTGEQRSTVANHLRLLDLCEPAKEYLRAGKLTFGHAKVLAGIPDILEQARLAELVVKQELSVRNLERVIKLPAPSAGKSPHRPLAAGRAHYAELEQSFTRQIGLRVEIRPSPAGKGKGKVVLHYSSLEEFDNLAERLAVELPDA
jgi:ParB family transcriptional regulator, chromosome partitioning protein